MHVHVHVRTCTCMYTCTCTCTLNCCVEVCIVGQAPNCRGVQGSSDTCTGRAHAHTATSRSVEQAGGGERGGRERGGWERGEGG